MPYLSDTKELGDFPSSSAFPCIKIILGLYVHSPENNLDGFFVCLFFHARLSKFFSVYLDKFQYKLCSILHLLLLKFRDQLLHFVLRYPSFKTINVLWVHNGPGQRSFIHSTKSKCFFSSLPLRMIFPTAFNFTVFTTLRKYFLEVWTPFSSEVQCAWKLYHSI